MAHIGPAAPGCMMIACCCSLCEVGGHYDLLEDDADCEVATAREVSDACSYNAAAHTATRVGSATAPGNRSIGTRLRRNSARRRASDWQRWHSHICFVALCHRLPHMHLQVMLRITWTHRGYPLCQTLVDNTLGMPGDSMKVCLMIRFRA